MLHTPFLFLLMWGEEMENTVQRNLFGRRQILTGASEITEENVVKEIAKAYTTHLTNKGEIDYLFNYYRGKQPILGRVKEVRPEINNMIVENRANAIVTFRVGYTVGKPIQYVSADGKDNVSENIAKFNDIMRVSGKATKDKQLVEWQMICGTGYRLVLPAADKSRVPFELYTLDPRQAFVIYRNDVANTPLAGVYYIVDDEQNVNFHVYTASHYFEVVGHQSGKLVNFAPHAIGRIPIVEYPLNLARLGSFETVLGLLDALNNLDSNNLDSVEQTVQSLLVAVNCDFDDGVTANTIRESGMVALKSVGDNHADIKIIGETLKQTDTQTLKESIIQAIYEIAGIPSQGNGSTGDSSNNGAVVLKNGWQGAETKAQDFEMMFREPEQRTIELMCDMCKRLGNVNLDPDKVDVKFTRRNYEDLLSKSQTLVTMLGNDKIHPQSAYEACGLFVDVQDAYNMGMEWYKKQLEREAEEENAGQTASSADSAEDSDAAAMDGHKAGEQSAQGTWVSGYWQKRGDRK